MSFNLRSNRILISVCLGITFLTASASATPQTAAFTYQGQLKDAGNPVNGPHNFTFSLWDSSVGGTQIGQTLIFDGVGTNPPPITVTDGLFSISLDFGVGVFNGQERWLEITVDGAPLASRQSVSAAPYAVFALNAANGHALDSVDGARSNVVYVDADGHVGIGTTTPENAEDWGGVLDLYHAANSKLSLRNQVNGIDARLMVHNAGIYGAPVGFILGTKSNHPLSFVTSGAARMAIATNGSVGIGTTSPTSLFHIASANNPTLRIQDTSQDGRTYHIGINSTDDSLRISNTGVGDRIVITADGNIGIGTSTPTHKLSVFGTIQSASGGFRFPDGTLQTTAAADQWAANGNDIFNRNSGNVGIGIGVTPPDRQLTIGRGMAVDYLESSDGTVATGVRFGTTTSGEGIASKRTAGGNRYGLDFFTASISRLSISSNGNVGIGTTEPISRLHIANNSDNTNAITIDSGLTESRYTGINFLDRGARKWGIGKTPGNDFYIDQDGLGRAITVKSGQGGSPGVPIRVGIGIDNPQSRLAVRDEIGVYDDIRDRAGIYISNGQGVVFGDTLAMFGTKNFCIPHPNDPTKEIWYSCVEGPEAGIYARGTASLVNGRAVILLPEHFRAVASAEGLTVHVTPLSAKSLGLAVTRKNLDGVVVEELQSGSGSYDFDWEVKAVRAGYEGFQPVRPLSEIGERAAASVSVTNAAAARAANEATNGTRR